MMKRSMTNGAVLHDPAAPKEHYVTVSKAPNTDTTKVVWHVDPAALVGPREEEARRKAPEAKFLYAISAILTIMVLWGVFRHVHYLVPRAFLSSRVDDTFTLEQIDRVDSSAADFDSDVGGQMGAAKHLLEFDVDSSGIGGRRTAKHLLEMPGERFVLKHHVRRVGNLHKVRDSRQGRTDATRSGGYRFVH